MGFLVRNERMISKHATNSRPRKTAVPHMLLLRFSMPKNSVLHPELLVDLPISSHFYGFCGSNIFQPIFNPCFSWVFPSLAGCSGKRLLGSTWQRLSTKGFQKPPATNACGNDGGHPSVSQENEISQLV